MFFVDKVITFPHLSMCTNPKILSYLELNCNIFEAEYFLPFFQKVPPLHQFRKKLQSFKQETSIGSNKKIPPFKVN